jgi:hypothetical protein
LAQDQQFFELNQSNDIICQASFRKTQSISGLYGQYDQLAQIDVSKGGNTLMAQQFESKHPFQAERFDVSVKRINCSRSICSSHVSDGITKQHVQTPRFFLLDGIVADLRDGI